MNFIMFLLKIFYFLKGYVIIEINDERMSRFINALFEKNIKIINATSKSVTVRKCDFEYALMLSEEMGIEPAGVRECSVLNTLKKRSSWFFILSFLVFSMILYMSSGYIWMVKVVGCSDELADRVLKSAEMAGVRCGVRKKDLPKLNDIKEAVLYDVDELYWAWVHLEGVCARIEVRCKMPPPKLENFQTCNVVAAKAGYIIYISADHGRKLYTSGTWVEEGDVLISGVMPASEKYPAYEVAADGEVIAQTVYTKSCVYPLYKTYTKDTGYEKTLYSLRLFELEIPLYCGKFPDMQEYRTQVKAPPIGVCTKKYIETETVREEIPIETAVWEAKEALYGKIAVTLSRGAVKTDEKVTYKRISEDEIEVSLVMNFNEDIGIKKEIEGWQLEEITDDKTD